MKQSIDLINDPLADVPFTPQQREIWDTVRAELLIAREKMEELEDRLRVLERLTSDEPHIPAVLTRPEFNREVARMIAFDERYGGVSSILYFDIENLSEIRRILGGQVADNVIRVICDSLARHIRSSDLLGRLATEEFGILLARCDNHSAWSKGEMLAEILLQDLAKIPGCTIEPIINFGAYTFKEKENAATGIKKAAENMTKSHKKEE